MYYALSGSTSRSLFEAVVLAVSALRKAGGVEEAAGMGSREDQYTKYDEKMQAECYKLALETYWNEPWFAGMYWWKWFSNPDDSGIDADAHSPHGRKAGRILAEWYKKEHGS